MTSLRRQLETGLAQRFIIEKTLGEGGMATVFLARELHPDRHVAIKVLDPEVSTLITRTRFLREIDMAGKLAHPNILPVYSAGEVGDLLYCTMPFIPGNSLRQEIARKGALDVTRAMGIAAETADALGYAHGLGIIHRDIKPENILLSKGHALVADYGIGKAYGEASELQLTHSGVALGTPQYMSPEQARGQQVGPLSDIYSLGCVLFEMVTGLPPFTGISALQVMTHHAETPAPSMKVRGTAIPSGLQSIVKRCLEKDLKKRFQTGQELANALKKEAEGIQIDTRAAKVSKRRSRPTLAIGASVLLLSLLWRLTAGSAPSTYLLVALDNQTGTALLANIGAEIADSIATHLQASYSSGTLPLTPLVSPRAPTREALLSAARGAGARFIVHGSYYLYSDSLRFQLVITDLDLGTIVGAPPPLSAPLKDPFSAAATLSLYIEPILKEQMDRPKIGLGSDATPE